MWNEITPEHVEETVYSIFFLLDFVFCFIPLFIYGCIIVSFEDVERSPK